MARVTDGIRVLTDERIASQAGDTLKVLAGPDGTLSAHHGERDILLPPEIGRALQQILEVMAGGGTVTVTAMPDELTTSSAAELLGVSRPTVMRMIADGELEASKVGSHHRLKREDVLAVLAARRRRERAALEHLMELDT